jgi:guanylate kinase
MHKGPLFIISAPSGAGKTSLVKELIGSVENLSVSISHTTRRQRAGEQDGQDYFFVRTDEFKAMQQNHAFLEYAQVFDNLYGTSHQSLVNTLASGKDVILEIDWQGARQVKKILPESSSIFILPPSTLVLEKRLRSRGQDDEDTIGRRMRDAVSEISHYDEFDFIMVNDDFKDALMQLKSIIIASRMQMKRQVLELRSLLTALTN